MLTGVRRSSGRLLAVLASFSCAVYLNTLGARFTYDDYPAAVRNRDVTDPGQPLSALWHHDFWSQMEVHQSGKRGRQRLAADPQRGKGHPAFTTRPAPHPTRRGADISSSSSHKSYRPLTVLAFRLQHRLSTALFGEWKDTHARLPKQRHSINPLPYHACNVILHAMVTALVYRLAQRFVQGRTAGSKGAAPASALPANLEPFLAALLFALHPVHTEAVAGIVGQAELLCAALSIPALLCYMAAADGRVASLRAHWGHVVVAVLLGWAAALAKEIGITIMGTMMCYDALVAPAVLQLQHGKFATKHRQLNKRKAAGHQADGQPALMFKLQRMLFTALAVVLYIKSRTLLAGNQVPLLYRKSDNLVPYAPTSLARKLTAGYLHARYAGLLLAPVQLSADWSYACIDYVTGLSDPRNLATLALYLFLLFVVLAARPWDVLREWAGQKHQPTQAEHERRWRLAVTAGLLVGPFFPASNVLFYVGTTIGERLLYFPSVGYCILLAQPLAALLQRLSSHAPTGAAPSNQQRTHLWQAKATAVLLALLLCFFTARTVTRNADWHDDERLFEAARQVCWRSAKVQMNSGLTEQFIDWKKAEEHFQHAMEIDPDGLCVMGFHIGIDCLTGLPHRQPNITRGIEYLEEALGCRTAAAQAVVELKNALDQLTQRSPQHAAAYLERWGTALARPELQRFAEAAIYFENAALKATHALQAEQILDRARAILSAAKAHVVSNGTTPEFPVRHPAFLPLVERMVRCVEARTPLLVAIVASRGSEDGLQGQHVKLATHRYLEQHGEVCRTPMQAPGTDPEHTVELHKVVVHMLLEADPADPRLRQEWELTLAASGHEAFTHLEPAGTAQAAEALRDEL